MDIFDQILEYLELERDLGTRTVEIDRALLVLPSSKPATPPPPKQKPAPAPPTVSVPPQNAPIAPPAPPSAPPAPAPSPEAVLPQCDIAFFSGKELSAAGMEMMAKISAAIGKIRSGVTVCLNEERKAKVCVLLGSDALLKRLPSSRPVRGGWVTIGDTPAIMTFSPDYILSHFREGSPNMDRAKREMWSDIKLAVARLGGIKP